MEQARVDSKESIAGGWFGAREEAQLPVHSKGYAPYAADEPAPVRRSWFRTGLKLVRDAAIAVAIMALMPMAIVAFRGDGIWRGKVNPGSINAKLAQAESWRPLRLPADPSITPMQAGLAFNALQTTRVFTNYPMVDVPRHYAAPWQRPIDGKLFAGSHSASFFGPSEKNILELVSRGFTADEMAYLKKIATAPLWRDFDLVARAPAVDFTGGMFRTPFSERATSPEYPIVRFDATKELANASVSRAAYYLAVGQRAEAERVLRSTASFGFALVDQSHNYTDQLVGRIIVDIARDALRRLYVITGDSRATSAAVAPAADGLEAPPRFVDDLTNRQSRDVTSDQLRQGLIARSANPAISRAQRFETLSLLSMSSCTNVRELLLGTRTDVTDAFTRARAELARYPSERALLDLQSQTVERTRFGPNTDFIGQLFISSATVAGVVLHNPRLAACTRIALQ